MIIFRVQPIFLKYCCENLSFHNISDQRRKHILIQQIFPADRTIYFSQLLETNLLPKTTISKTQLTFICSNSTILTVQ